MHSRLSTIVEGIESNLSFPVFMWVLCIVFSVCVKIEAIVSGIKHGKFEDFGYILTGLKIETTKLIKFKIFDLDVLYYTFAFVIISLVASEVGEENSGPSIA